MVIKDQMLVEIFLSTEIFEILWFIDRHDMISSAVEQFKCEKSSIEREREINLFLLVCKIQTKYFLVCLYLIKLNSYKSCIFSRTDLYLFSSV